MSNLTNLISQKMRTKNAYMSTYIAICLHVPENRQKSRKIEHNVPESV